MKNICVSGHFQPLHVGHIQYLALAKELAGKDGQLVVIVNSDEQAILKKGKSFMPQSERLEIIKALRMVDHVFLAIDTDRTVCKTIEHIHESIPLYAFCNGGDRHNDNIPETEVCRRLGILLIDGLGEKIQSSSALTGY